MKKPARIVLWALCALMILLAPFTLSSPNMLGEVKSLMTEDMEEEEYEEGAGLLRFFLSTAAAEEAEAASDEDAEAAADEEPEAASGEDAEEAPLTSTYELPVDFSVPPEPNPAGYSENGYEDESIRVRLEDREEDGVLFHLAFVQIASPTQLRTATAAAKLTSTKAATVSGMAKHNHAVVAINGDNYQDDTAKKSFEYRMTEKIRRKGNKLKDILIIDSKGDFHFFVKSEGVMDFDESEIINAWTFGPALVIDGVVQTVDPKYGYNPGGKEPRAAIGQTGTLSYVFVIAEGRSSKSEGISQQKLADFMGSIGCTQAFNLDGGNSGEMVFGETIYKAMPGGSERGLNDIIYFATAVPEDNR